jgi:hypothetical protein
MGEEWVGQNIARNKLRVPIFKAIDELRLALEASIELGDDVVSDLLLIAIHDLADTIDVVDGEPARAADLDWSVSPKSEP